MPERVDFYFETSKCCGEKMYDLFSYLTKILLEKFAKCIEEVKIKRLLQTYKEAAKIPS